MIFEYIITDKYTKFIYRIEDKTEMSGMGETSNVTLLKPYGHIYFNYSVKNPHNDIMAFIIIVIFKPFIKNNITFKFEISKYFIDSLKKVDYYKNIKFINTKIVDYPKFKGDKISITVGGGLDSAAIMCLFNDTYLYHQEGKEIVDVNTLAKKCKCKNKVDIVNSNIKKIIKPQIFTHWISVFVGIYLLAQDQKIGYIFLGSIIEGEFMKKGIPKNIYNPKFYNNFELLSNNLGIKMIKPMKGISSIITAKICTKYNILDHTISCDKGHNHTACNKCNECLRKQLELSFYDNGKRNKKYWSQYSDKIVYNDIYLQRKFPHIYLTSSRYGHLNKPLVLREYVNKYKPYINKHKNLNITWVDKIYPPYYNALPCRMKVLLLNKLLKEAPLMNDTDIKNFKNFNIDKVKIDIFENFIDNDNSNHNIIKLIVFMIMLIIIINFK